MNTCPQRKAAGDGFPQTTSQKETKLRVLVELILECASGTPTKRLKRWGESRHAAALDMIECRPSRRVTLSLLFRIHVSITALQREEKSI